MEVARDEWCREYAGGTEVGLVNGREHAGAYIWGWTD